MAEHVIGPASQVPPGEGRIFVVGGTEIAVFRTRGGAVFATQARCPHRGGPLADGLTDETTVICPLHERIYDLASGAGIGTDCAIATFPARIADQLIYVAAPGLPVSSAP